MKSLHWTAGICLVVLCLFLVGCQTESESSQEKKPDTAPLTFAQAMKSVLKNTQPLTPPNKKEGTTKAGVPVPPLLRTFATTIRTFDKERRAWLQTDPLFNVEFLKFRWEQGRITVSWTGTLMVPGERPEAAKMLNRAMKNTGYVESLKDFKTHLAEDLRRFHATRPPEPIGYVHATDKTREELLISRFGTRKSESGLEPSAGDYEWCVTCEYQGKAPTLKELLLAMPSYDPWHRETPLFDRLLSEPVYHFSTYLVNGPRHDNGWELTTSASAQKDIQKILKDQGFEPCKDKYLERKSDHTYAAVAPSEGNVDRIVVWCRPPQTSRKKE